MPEPVLRAVLFGGPLDHRELEIVGGTEKVSFAKPSDPSVFVTYVYKALEKDQRGKYMSFHYDPKAAPPQMVNTP